LRIGEFREKSNSGFESKILWETRRREETDRERREDLMVADRKYLTFLFVV
jgi:hypothetical protein